MMYNCSSVFGFYCVDDLGLVGKVNVMDYAGQWGCQGLWNVFVNQVEYLVNDQMIDVNSYKY